MKNKTVIQHVEGDKGDHQHQDGVGSSGPWGAFVVPSGGVNILRPLVGSVQEKHHGAAGADHEANKHGIRGGPKVAKACDSETEQDPMVLARPPHVLSLPFVCGKTLAKE